MLFELLRGNYNISPSKKQVSKVYWVDNVEVEDPGSWVHKIHRSLTKITKEATNTQTFFLCHKILQRRVASAPHHRNGLDSRLGTCGQCLKSPVILHTTD